MVYLKGSGIGVPGHFQIVVEKSAFMAYNILNKRAESWMRPAAGKYDSTKSSALLYQSEGATFCVKCK